MNHFSYMHCKNAMISLWSGLIAGSGSSMAKLFSNLVHHRSNCNFLQASSCPAHRCDYKAAWSCLSQLRKKTYKKKDVVHPSTPGSQPKEEVKPVCQCFWETPHGILFSFTFFVLICQSITDNWQGNLSWYVAPCINDVASRLSVHWCDFGRHQIVIYWIKKLVEYFIL